MIGAGLLATGYGVGQVGGAPSDPTPTSDADLTATVVEAPAPKCEPPVTIVELKELIGDELLLEISGPTRVVWPENQMVEGEGEHLVPMGQVLTANDKPFLQFPYAGNEKTNKFYNADSYSARGTAVEHRRFFESFAAAEAAGFVPAKSTKREGEQ